MEEVRRAILGRDGIMANAYNALKTLPVGDRVAVGTVLNSVRSRIEEVFLRATKPYPYSKQPIEESVIPRELIDEAMIIAGLHPDLSIKPRVVSVEVRLSALKFLINTMFGVEEEEPQCSCLCSCTDKDSQ